MGGDVGCAFAKAKTGGRSEVSMVLFTGKDPRGCEGQSQRIGAHKFGRRFQRFRESDAGGRGQCAVCGERVLRTISFSRSDLEVFDSETEPVERAEGRA